MSTNAQTAGAALELLPLLTGLFGGLALFLYGMDKMAGALKTIAGDRMRSILARLTSNRIMGAITGAFITGVIQSSSVTTVLVVGFISAGLMTLSQSVGIIMGANIGTTITAQIIAFKVTKFALLMVAAGFGMLFVGRREATRHYGAGLMGLGLVFFGMAVMGDAMRPLRDSQPFIDWMIRMESPAVGIMAGALFTALVQSSSATTGVVIVMAGQGLISLPAGIALIFGANIGTCVTALLAAIGKPRDALRAAVVHVAFNVVGVIVWLPFIDRLAQLVTAVSLAADTPRQIANAHSIFNIANTVLLLGLSTQLARFIEWLLPDRAIDADRAVHAKYLDSALLDTPSLALDRVRLEILHMGNRVQGMLQAILPAVLSGTRDSLEAVARMDDAVDTLHGQILTFLGRISRKTLTEQQTDELLKLMEAVNDLENIGDIIETNLVTLGMERLDYGVTISEATREVIGRFHTSVHRGVEAAVMAVTQKNPKAAKTVVRMKNEINRLAESAALHEAQRLVAREPHRLQAYTIEVDVLRDLKRIFYFAKRMARAATPTAIADVVE